MVSLCEGSALPVQPEEREKNGRHCRNNTVYFSIDTETFPNKGVKGKGTAKMISDSSEGVPVVERMLEKYLGDTKSSYPKAMKESVRKGSAVVVEIRPHYYTVWDYTKGL